MLSKIILFITDLEYYLKYILVSYILQFFINLRNYLFLVIYKIIIRKMK